MVGFTWIGLTTGYGYIWLGLHLVRLHLVFTRFSSSLQLPTTHYSH